MVMAYKRKIVCLWNKLTKWNHFARIERAAEADIDIIVEEPRVVAHRVRMDHRRRIRNGTMYEVVEVDVVDALSISNLIPDCTENLFSISF